MNALLLHLLIREIREALSNRRIQSIRYLPPLVVIDLSRRSMPGYLVIVRSDPGPFCFLSPSDPVGSLGTEIFKRIYGNATAAAPAIPADRILRLPLAGNLSFSIALFGSAAKMRLEGTDGTIVESLDSRETGSSPRAPTVDPGPAFAVMPRAAIATAIRGGRRVPGLDAELLDAFDGAHTAADLARLVDFRDGLLAGRIPFCLGTRGRAGRVGPLPDPTGPGHMQHRFGPFSCFESACLDAGNRLVETARTTILRREAGPIRKRLDARRHLGEKLRGQLDAAHRFGAGRNEANVLAAYRTRIPAGASHIILPDLYTPGKSLSIELDPSQPLDVQIDKRFKRASKLERSRAILATRIERVDAEVAALQRALAIGEAGAFQDRIRALRDARATFAPPQPPGRTTGPSHRPASHRRFDLGSGWFALVGRNDRENDEITFRVAGPDDLWMHAQQVPGSHVVLKSSGVPGNPPQPILEAAAAVAAFFSKARHAGLVPVIYTRRKYVRKLRGGRPGQVTCEREKTVFAEPRLPETAGG